MSKPLPVRLTISTLLWFKDMNPNGNPNLENEPRSEVYNGETFGLQTDVCLKRLIRDSLSVLYPKEPLYHDKKTLISEQNKRCAEIGADGKPIEVDGKDIQGKKRLADNIQKKHIDVRLFGLCGVDGKSEREESDEEPIPVEEGKGAKKKKGEKASFIPEVRTGPVRLSLSRSIHPIVLEKDPIVRTTHSSSEGVGTFGKYDRIRAGLYHFTTLYTPSLAPFTGCTEDDVEKMLEAIVRMTSTIQSRGRRPVVVGCYVFKHTDTLGNGADEVLTELVLQNIRHNNGFKDVKDFSEFEIPEAEFLTWALKQKSINATVSDYLLKYGHKSKISNMPTIEEWKLEKEKREKEKREKDGPPQQLAAGE